MPRRLSIYLGSALLPCMLLAQEPPTLVPALGWDPETQGKFVTSVVADLQNNIWAGTEGNGLWRYDSRKKEWSHFISNDGLGGGAKEVLADDYVYALAVDKLGRVWVGHLNHGVSVWNGEKWKNYGLLDGPLGDRVFAIATCPTDGDVWIATDCGVARYSIAKDDWDYYTRASGLPSNQIQAIAFDSKGNVFLGTQCDGLAMATASDNYKKWKTVPGPRLMPTTGTGDGLPSALINDIVVTAGDKMILVATPEGIGESDDGGQKWKFIRGQDWLANVNGLYPAPGPDIDPPPTPVGQDALLFEDWTTSLRQDPASKNIWVGHHKRGIEVRSEGMDKFVTGAAADGYTVLVRGICIPAKGPPLLAVADTSSGGLQTLDKAAGELEPGAEPPATAPPLPSPAKAPDAATLAALAKHLDVFKNQLKPGQAVFLGDDWRTEGDWEGHYGNSFALLCGLDTKGVFQGEPDYDVEINLGPHNKEQGAQGPSSSIKDANSTYLRTPYDPISGHRVEAETNDRSSARFVYQPYWEGPDLWLDTKVPAGIHCVSLYFYNNDEQQANGDFANKCRDYDIQVLPWADDADAVQKAEPLARARVDDFRGGVYKEFVVAGPAHVVIRVGRNHSFCTKLQGVFIDRLSHDGPEKLKPVPGFEAVDYAPAVLKDKSAIEGDATLSAASGLWDALDKSFDKPGVDGLQFPLHIAAYRAAAAVQAPAALLEQWRWQMGIWTKEDRDAFDKAMADAFKDYSAKNPPAKQDDEKGGNEGGN